MANIRRILIICFIGGCFFIACKPNLKEAKSEDLSKQGIDIQINDTCLYRLLDEHINNGHIDKSKCVFQLFVISSTYYHTKYYLTYALNVSNLIRYAPAGCFYIKDECILYYTGFDKFFINRNKDIRVINFAKKTLYWDVDLPLHKSEIDRKNWVMMQTKMTRLYTYDFHKKSWIVEGGNDDILFENIPQKCETEYFRNP